MPYNNGNSVPECKYYPANNKSVVINNLTFNRSPQSKYKTYLCEITGIDGFTIENVAVNTPENNGENDQIITINNCTNVYFNSLIIDGTYSRPDYSGYGIAMNNVWNFSAHNMYGHGNWGVFGTNNISNVSITNSDINRFDIHCYGRDVSFKSVTFRNKYNQFSSVYGTISFDECVFINCVPVVNGHSYNAYVGYELVFNNCVYSTIYDTPILIDEGYLDNLINPRPELTKRCLPNVTINNLTLSIPKIAPIVYLFFFRERGKKQHNIDYLSNLYVNNLQLRYDGDGNRTPADFMVSNVPIKVVKPLKETLLDIDIIGNSKKHSSFKGVLVNNLELNPVGSKLSTNKVHATSFVKKKH